MQESLQKLRIGADDKSAFPALVCSRVPNSMGLAASVEYTANSSPANAGGAEAIGSVEVASAERNGSGRRVLGEQVALAFRRGASCFFRLAAILRSPQLQ